VSSQASVDIAAILVDGADAAIIGELGQTLGATGVTYLSRSVPALPHDLLRNLSPREVHWITMECVADRIDLSKRASYIRARHGVDTTWADEAADDTGAAWLNPDPTSASGLSVRVIGYSPSADEVLTAILLPADTDPADPPDRLVGNERLAIERRRPAHLRTGTGEVVRVSKVDDIIAAESDALEQAELPDPLPARARVGRRNDTRSRMFSVRLRDDELAEHGQVAQQRGLPARTLARTWLLDRLHTEQHSGSEDLAARVERLEHAVFPG